VPGFWSSGASCGHVGSGSVATRITPSTPNAISLLVSCLNLPACAMSRLAPRISVASTSGLGTDLMSRMPRSCGQKTSRSATGRCPVMIAAAIASSGARAEPSRARMRPSLSAMAKRSTLGSCCRYSRAIGCTVFGSCVSTAAFSGGKSAMKRASRAKFSNWNRRYSFTSVAASSIPRWSSASVCRVAARVTDGDRDGGEQDRERAVAKKIRLVSDEKTFIGS
jgi:hypothetical protein